MSQVIFWKKLELFCIPLTFYRKKTRKGVCFKGRFPNRRPEDLDLAALAKFVNSECGGHAPAAPIFPLSKDLDELIEEGKLNRDKCLSKLNGWIKSFIQSKSATSSSKTLNPNANVFVPR